MVRRHNHYDDKIFQRSLKTGFVGGIFWGALALLLHYFNFTELHPKTFILKSWVQSNWTDKWQGDIVTLLLLGLLSLVISALYYMMFRKINSMWPGVIYGLVLVFIFFVVIYPLFTEQTPLSDLKFATYTTTVCLFVLYGLFVGYSISYDYYDMKVLGNQGIADRS